MSTIPRHVAAAAAAPLVAADERPDAVVKPAVPARRRDWEAGMATAEYAVGTVAAAGLGGILYKIVTSDWFAELLKAIFEIAFKGILV